VPESATINPALQVTQGQIIWGTVVNVAPFGLFIELVPRLDGLLQFDRSVSPNIAKQYQKGQRIKVEVKSVNLKQVKVELDLSLGEPQLDGGGRGNA
jgi:small subunit ribosomal protein S1